MKYTRFITATILIQTAAWGAQALTFSDQSPSGPRPDLWTLNPGDRSWGGLKIEPKQGIAFDVPSRATASAKWEVGVAPFEFWFDLEVDKGRLEAWRYNGLAVALCSAPPMDMTDKDVAIVAGIYQAGVQCAVKTGPFFKPGLDKKVPLFHAVSIEKKGWPKRAYELTMTGAAGENFSIQWPKQELDGLRLRFRIQRQEGNRVHFEVFNADGDFSRPWWIGETTLPDNLAVVPIRHIVVQSVEYAPNDDKSPPPNATLKGRLFGFKGWTGQLSAPAVTGYESGNEGLENGREFRVKGSGFADGAVVLINGTPAKTSFQSATELKVVANGLLTDSGNTLQVVNPDGLFATSDEKLHAGLFLAEARPFEAMPKGGDLITLKGGGFGAATRVTVNRAPAEVVGTPGSSEIQVRVPPGSAGPAVIAASNGAAVFGGAPAFGYAPHPYMLVPSKEALEAQKKKFNSPAFANYRKAFLLMADSIIGPVDDQKRNMGPDRGEAVLGAAFAYAMTGEEKYKKAFFDLYKVFMTENDLLLPTAHNYPGNLRQLLNTDQFHYASGARFALAYDLLFEELTPEMRATMGDYIRRRMRFFKKLSDGNDWWFKNNPSNTIPVGNCAGGQCALALINSVPEAVSIVGMAVKNIKTQFKAFESDGGITEGSMYHNFGVGSQVFFGMTLENALNDDKGLLTDPRLQKTGRWVQTQLGGDGEMFSFSDTGQMISGVLPIVFAGSRFDDPLCRWVGDEAVRRIADEEVAANSKAMTPKSTSNFGGEMFRPSYSVPAILLRDEKPAPATIPPLPVADALEVVSWGVLRSAPDAYMKGLVLGVKGVGGVLTHHAQEDAGSFVLQSRGESFLFDPGYFNDSATQHSLPLVGDIKPGAERSGVNGAGQQVTWVPAGAIFKQTEPAPLSDKWESGSQRSITVDSSKSYKSQKDKVAGSPVSMVRRVFVLDGEKGAVVLDQIQPTDPTDKIKTLFQARVPVTLIPGDNGFRLEGAKSDVIGMVDGPAPEAVTVESLAFRTDWGFAKIGIPWNRITSPYPYQDNQPRITVLLPVDKGAAAPEVAVKREGKAITIQIAGGSRIAFAEEGGIWKSVKP
jgi:hypothetical protein